MVKILYEDNHLLALSKPVGMPTQPNEHDSFSLEEWGKKWIKEKYDKKGNVFLEAVHRIDKPVSGIVLFAKTSKALSRMQECIRNHQCKKIYHALVEGRLEKKEGTLEDFLIHDQFLARSDPNGKLAILNYRMLEERENKTFIEITLITGRYHQIRFQFSSRGHPIVGDTKYGSSQTYPGGIALHHHQLEIMHPTTRESIIVKDPQS